MDSAALVTGVIEGFYGRPWSRAERLELFDSMAGWGLSTYFYAPKDDLHHRALWREPYPPAELEALRELIDACSRRGLHFIYGPSPGRDIRYGIEADLGCLRGRVEQMLSAGCRGFSLLFDDIPDVLNNLHANDYDGSRLFCGPYSGRPLELRTEVSGLLSNPNNECPLNDVPLRTLAEFCRHDGPAWDSREAYLAAMRDWSRRFDTIGAPSPLEDLIFFGDCFYLPFEDGAQGGQFYEGAWALLARAPSDWGGDARQLRLRIGRLRGVCTRITELRHRPLFYALSRRVWELREQLDRLERLIDAIEAGTSHDRPVTRAGGMVARLQQLR